MNLMMNEAALRCKRRAVTARCERVVRCRQWRGSPLFPENLQCRDWKSVWPELCKTRITGSEGLKSFSWMAWSLAQRWRKASMPSPPPPMASTAERSSATMRADESACACTTSRSLKTESLWTILPLHSINARVAKPPNTYGQHEKPPHLSCYLGQERCQNKRA